jgi:hypothetical protein
MNNNTHYLRTKNAVNTLLNAVDEIRNVNYEYVNAGMGTELTDEVLAALGSDLTNAEYTTIISSIQAILALMDAGHASNMLKIKG